MRQPSTVSCVLVLLTGCFHDFGTGPKAVGDAGRGADPALDDSGATGGFGGSTAGRWDASAGSGGSTMPATGGAVARDARSGEGGDFAAQLADARLGADVVFADTASADAKMPDARPPVVDARVADAPSAPITVVGHLAAPGTSPEGITFDGQHVWLSDNSSALFEVSPTGDVLDSFYSPEPTPQGLTWDGANLWIYTTNYSAAYALQPRSAQHPLQTATFKLPTQVIGGGITNDLAWDGSALWYANQYKVFRLSPTGATLASFSFGRNIAGIDWDGSRLWIVYLDSASKTTFSALDAAGKVVASFPSPLTDVQAIAWGAKDHIWVLGSDAVAGSGVYELDASAARASLP